MISTCSARSSGNVPATSASARSSPLPAASLSATPSPPPDPPPSGTELPHHMLELCTPVRDRTRTSHVGVVYPRPGPNSHITCWSCVPPSGRLGFGDDVDADAGERGVGGRAGRTDRAGTCGGLEALRHRLERGAGRRRRRRRPRTPAADGPAEAECGCVRRAPLAARRARSRSRGPRRWATAGASGHAVTCNDGAPSCAAYMYW